MNKATMIGIFPDDEDIGDVIDIDILQLEAEHTLGKVPDEVFNTTIVYLTKYKMLLDE